jgi:hypothetical protein
VLEGAQVVLTWIEAAQARRHGAHPERAFAVEQHGADPIIGQAQGVIGEVMVMLGGAVLAVDRIDAVTQVRDPQGAGRIHREGGHVALRNAVGFGRGMVTKGPGARIPLGHAAGFGAHPQQSAAILVQGDHVVIGQRRGIGRVVVIVGEVIAQPLVERQARRRADPQAPAAVLQQRLHALARQAVPIGGAIVKHGVGARVGIAAQQS